MAEEKKERARQHASGGPPAPSVGEPTYAERVRTLLERVSVATLSTVSRRHTGYPFGSMMPFALDRTGRPLLLISSMAVHTQNLKGDPRCSLFAVQPAADEEPLGAARATLMGDAAPVPQTEHDAAREAYLARHPGSSYWIDFADFTLFRIEPSDLYYVGGFGVMGWVAAADYASAEPDPLLAHAPGILGHMNQDHVGSMILIARSCARIEATKAVMTAVDRLGFQLRLQTTEGVKSVRIPFLREVRTPQATREVLVEMVRGAQE